MDKILVLDFGGQYAHLIARRFRNMGYYSEIASPDIERNNIKNVKGIVLSGGPSSVYDNSAPHFNTDILEVNVPILGLCYGHQILIKSYSGIVKKAKVGEFGFASLNKINESSIFENVIFPTQVWMSHNDEVTKLPSGFEIIASTKDCKNAAVENIKSKRYGLQFHAEVKDTLEGNKMLLNFAKICKMEKNWDRTKILKNIEEMIKLETKGKKVLLFLSGGVDSSVAFALLNRTIGKDRVLGLYINNGFMRKNETESIANRYKDAGFDNFIIENAEKRFLKSVENIADPQQKRKNVGETFLKIKDEIVNRMDLNEDEWLLGQGTLYPDIIESGGTKHSEVIKTHHNRVEGVKQLMEKGLIIEPLKDLYKDEVRAIGKTIKLPDVIINRHPFPGPGISINLLCSDGNIDNENELYKTIGSLNKLEINKYLNNREHTITALPVRSVGVQGDFRTYNYPAMISINNILNDFPKWDELEKYSSYITNKIRNVNRVIIELFKKKECKLIKGFCTKDRLDMIREVDDIVLDELKQNGLYNKVFQHLTINLPYASKISNCSIVLRPVVSEDVMTARFAHLDIKVLKNIINRIKSLDFVDALYYDITNKPPATFGWE